MFKFTSPFLLLSLTFISHEENQGVAQQSSFDLFKDNASFLFELGNLACELSCMRQGIRAKILLNPTKSITYKLSFK